MYLAQDKPVDSCQANQTTFLVAPVPNSAYKLNLTGSFRPSYITSFTSEVTAVPAQYHQDVVVYGVAMIGAGRLQDDRKLKAAAAQYEAGVKKMIDEDKRQPDLEYSLQPYRASGRGYKSNYWQSPFVQQVE